MTRLADLHTHSTASDGQLTPSELVWLAKERGLRVLALTDHDTLGGLDEAVAAGEKLGIYVLRGVELSAEEYPNLHILGYGFLPTAPGLKDMCEKFQQGRDRRKYSIRDYLHAKGVEIPLEEVEAAAAGGVVGRPHFAQVMVDHGYVNTRREAFDKYLDTKEFQSFDKGTKPSAKTCIESIKSAGGKVSLAHPYQIMLGRDSLDTLIQRLTSYGLDAIECFYPKHTPEQQAMYLGLAKKYGLHITGGSDFHGKRVKPDVELAELELDLDWIIEEGSCAV